MPDLLIIEGLRAGTQHLPFADRRRKYGCGAQPGYWTVAKVYEMFPRLKDRRNNFGNQLSSSGQQMLPIGRALILNPTVLLLDMSPEGLALIIVDELLKALGTITRSGGLCSIIVDWHSQKILGLADRVVIWNAARSCMTPPAPR